MRKYRLAPPILIVFLIVAGIILLIYFIFFRVPMKTLCFAENNKTLVNPGRGFYVQFDADHTDKMQKLRAKGITLALVAFDIKDFTHQAISVEKLKELSAALQNAEKNGLQVILRTAYGFESSDKYKDPIDIELVKKHIAQIAPIINNSNTVLCVQAGFLGPWGEWHSSNLLTSDERSNTLVRNELLTCLLKNLNSKVVVDVRRPRFVRDAVAAGLDSKRIGVHNDALLSTTDDMGTYDDTAYDRAKELSWIGSNLYNEINGGEMPKISSYSTSENALREFKQLHLTYLNHEYNADVLTSWNTEKLFNQNALEYIGNHLGYRFSLKTVRLPQRITNGSSMKLEISMANTGFASVAKPCNVQVIVKSQNGTYFYPIQSADLQSLQPNTNYCMKTKILLPGELQGETVQVGLKIQEKSESNQSDLSRCIELANENFQYENHINFFCEYKIEKGKYTLQDS